MSNWLTQGLPGLDFDSFLDISLFSIKCVNIVFLIAKLCYTVKKRHKSVVFITLPVVYL